MIERISFSLAVDITGTLGLIFLLMSSVDANSQSDQKTQRFTHLFLILIFNLLSDILTCLCTGRPRAQLMLYVGNTASFVLFNMLVMVFSSYVRLEAEMKPTQWRHGSLGGMSIHFVMILALLTNPLHKQFFYVDPELGLIRQGRLILVPILMPVFTLLSCAAAVLRCRDVPWRKRIPLICYCLFLSIGCGLQHIYDGLSMESLMALLASLMLYSGRYMEQNKTISSKELELENTRAALVLSQIQPHFLFNSMAAVMDLCDTNPQEAKAALQELSDYLHYKISAMSHTYVVPFREDLEFLNNYLRLEKRRFGDRLRLEYDIRCQDFPIPLLTLQPLVENAIRHGISKKQEGGIICIRTWEDAQGYAILVEDDGVGFDATAVLDGTTGHVGIANVRNRLAALCSGNMSIRSAAGQGTAIEIRIPKEASV